MKQNSLLFNIIIEKAEYNLQYKKYKAVVEEVDWFIAIMAIRTKATIIIKEDKFASKISIKVKTLAI